MMECPATEIIRRSHWAAINGKKLHLDVEHAQWIAQHPDLQALLARVAAEETARLCQSRKPPMDDSPGLPLFGPAPRSLPTPAAQQPPANAGSGRREPSSGSNGAPSEGNISSLGTIAPLVQDAASQQASDQVQATIRLSKRTRRLQRDTRSGAGLPSPRPLPRPVRA